MTYQKLVPTHFIEVWTFKHSISIYPEMHRPLNIRWKNDNTKLTAATENLYTIAVFNIKPTSIPLAERLALRRAAALQIEYDPFDWSYKNHESFNRA